MLLVQPLLSLYCIPAVLILVPNPTTLNLREILSEKDWLKSLKPNVLAPVILQPSVRSALLVRVEYDVRERVQLRQPLDGVDHVREVEATAAVGLGRLGLEAVAAEVSQQEDLPV